MQVRAFFCIFLFAWPVLADTVILRSGEVIEGTIRELTAGHVTVETADGQVIAVEKGKVRRIGYGPVKAKPARPEAVPPPVPPDRLRSREDFDFYRQPPPVFVPPSSPSPSYQPEAPLPLPVPDRKPAGAPVQKEAPARARDWSPTLPGQTLEFSIGNGQFHSFLPGVESGLRRLRTLYGLSFYPERPSSFTVGGQWQFQEESQARLIWSTDIESFYIAASAFVGKSVPYYRTATIYDDSAGQGSVLEFSKVNRLRREGLALRLGYGLNLEGWHIKPFVGYGGQNTVSRIHSRSLGTSAQQFTDRIPELWDYSTDLDRSQLARIKGPLGGFIMRYTLAPWSLEADLQYQSYSGDFVFVNHRQVLVVETLEQQLALDTGKKQKPIHNQYILAERQTSRLTLAGLTGSLAIHFAFDEGRSVFLSYQAHDFLASHKRNRREEYAISREGEIITAVLDDLIRYRMLDGLMGSSIRSSDRSGLLHLGLRLLL